MILSIDAEKAFDKIQHLFLIKTLQSVGIEDTFLNLIKNINEKPTASIILNGGKSGRLSLKIRNTTRMPTLAIIIQHSTRSPCNSNQKGIKGIQIGKEEVKMSLFADDLILYMENPKESTPKLLEVIEQFDDVVGYKINAQKSVASIHE